MHKNLEDNYGAVITANHEALAQILEQVVSNFFIFFTMVIIRLLTLSWPDFFSSINN